MNAVKLGRPRSIFLDPETGLRVVGDEVVTLGDRVGLLTRTWLNAGGLVLVTLDPDSPPSAGGEQVPTSFPDAPSFSEEAIEPATDDEPEDEQYSEVDLRAMHIGTLKKLAKSLGVVTERNDSVNSLVEKILAQQG